MENQPAIVSLLSSESNYRMLGYDPAGTVSDYLS